MSCKSCESGNHREFSGEVAIRFPGLKGRNKRMVWVLQSFCPAWIVVSRNSQSPIPITRVTGRRARLKVKASDGCD